MIETFRSSSNFVIKQLYTNQFTKSGNLTITIDQNLAIFAGKRKKWGAALVSGDQKSRVSLELISNKNIHSTAIHRSYLFSFIIF